MQNQNEESHPKELKNNLDIILRSEYNHKATFQDEHLTGLKINTDQGLKKAQLSTLIQMADHYKMQIEIMRSGAGIKIEFTPEG